MRSLVLVAVGLVVALVAGCAPVVERARSAPVAAPAFVSEEEALEAAIEAYLAMTELADLIGIEGGKDAGRLSRFATGDFLAGSIQDFDAWLLEGKRQVGRSTVRDISLQQFDTESVNIYVCEDVSDVDVVGLDGVSTVSPTRGETFYLHVTLELVESALLVAHRERWDDREC